MPHTGYTVGVIAFLLLVLFAISVMVYNPLLGLIILFVAIILLGIVTDPSSAKVLIKLFIPVIILLLVLSVITDVFYGMNTQWAIVMVLIIFGAGILVVGFIGGVDASSGVVFAPMIVVPTLLAFLIDPSGSLAVFVASILLFGWMFFVYLLVKNMPPPYPVGFSAKVAVALENFDGFGKVKMGAEIWNAETRGYKIKKGDEVFIKEVRGLKLIVVPAVRCPHCGEPYPVDSIPDKCVKCDTDLSFLKFKV